MTVAVVVTVFLQKVWIDVEFGIQVEAFQVKHLAQRDFTKVHHLLRGAGVHVLQSVLQRTQIIGRDQIGFADEDLVGKTHLPARFLTVVQLLRRVFGIHQRQDGVEQKRLGDLIVHEKGLRHGTGIGQTGGLDHDAVKTQQTFAALGREQLQGDAQIFPNGAANAAIAHLNDLLLGVRDQDVVVDVFFAKFVLNDSDFLAMGLCQHALQERGFARTQKAGQDGGGDQ